MTMRVQRLLQSSSYKNSETIAAIETLASFELLDFDEDEDGEQKRPGSSTLGSGASAGTQLRRSVDRRLGSGARDFLGAFASVNAVCSAYI